MDDRRYSIEIEPIHNGILVHTRVYEGYGCVSNPRTYYGSMEAVQAALVDSLRAATQTVVPSDADPDF